MSTLTTVPLPAASNAVPSKTARPWGPFLSIVFRFFFSYWLLYSLPIILRFPAHLASLIVAQVGTPSPATGSWLDTGMSVLGYPEAWRQDAMNRFTPWVSQALLGVEVEPPTSFTGSGDRLFNYCTSWADLVIALAVTAAWTVASELGRRLKGRQRPCYDRLHALLRLIVRFHLMYQLLVYGAMKIWCAQFPPISDFQLETKYGDSSPMGLLWRFMQSSQPYTCATGIVEFTCGLLLLSRRTTLLGALGAAAALLQVFLLNMCYDVPVKLMSGHLLLMALTLIVPDGKRLFCVFVLGRAVMLRRMDAILGGRRLGRTAGALQAVVYPSFAALMLLGAYQDARHRGMLAPENPLHGRWVGREFIRDGHKVPFPEQPESPPPRPITPSKWQGGPGMPAVIRVALAPQVATLMFEDGSGVSYRAVSESPSELVLVRGQDGRRMAQLQVGFPEADVLTLEGWFDGQEVRMRLSKVRPVKKEYLLRTRGFHWVQETPFNR